MTPLWVALTTGLLGSWHCTAMCGPLVWASVDGEKQLTRPALAYFAGRFVSYATVGALLGHLGAHALHRLPLGGVEHVALALVAGFALWRARLAFGVHRQRDGRLITLGRRQQVLSLGFLASLLPRRGLGLGLATGILPCGMLLPAWVLAAATERAERGAIVMLVFAAASLPGLLAALWGKRVLQAWAVQLPRWVQGAAWLGLALWLLARPFLITAHHHHGG